MVHRSSIATNTTRFAMQVLRNQIGKHVYPVHRLDRKTAGVLLFALDKNTQSAMQKSFADGKVSKTYLAIVRGHTDDSGTINYPLKKENGTVQEAITHYKTIKRGQLDFPSHPHPTSRYSLVEVKPETGRMHQIRRHFAHIFHPIIGDRPHGCNKQNRFFKNQFNMNTMLLHASKIGFEHPVSGRPIQIRAEIGDEFKRMMKMIFSLPEF